MARMLDSDGADRPHSSRPHKSLTRAMPSSLQAPADLQASVRAGTSWTLTKDGSLALTATLRGLARALAGKHDAPVMKCGAAGPQAPSSPRAATRMRAPGTETTTLT